MNTHDLRIKYTDEFLAKGTKVSSADEALGIKAVAVSYTHLLSCRFSSAMIKSTPKLEAN